MSRASVLLAVTLGATLVGVARAATWADFQSAFPALPCHDGWMGCIVAGGAVSPDLSGAPADMRVAWFDLQPTAAFSPFVGLSEYRGGEAVVAAAAVEEPAIDDGGNDAVAMAPSEGTRKAQAAADDAAADAAAAAASEAEANRQAKAAEEARRAADAEAKRRREEESQMRKEADRLSRQAEQAAAAAAADEKARLAKEADEARKRATDAEAARMKAEEDQRRQREAEEDARRKAEEEQRRKAEADAARLAADEEARRQAEEERQRQAAADEEARRKKAEADALAAADAAKKKADADAAAAAAGNPSDGGDAAAMVDPAAMPAPPPPMADGDCSDLTQLEPSAILGKLSDGQIGCLEGRVATDPKMTDKEKVSLVLMANAWSKGDKQTWENLVKRHLDEIDQSDPDLCYKYSLHLSRQGPGRASGVIRWANVALENRTVWTGDTYTSRVYSLYKLRAAASQTLWKQAEQDHAAAPSDETRDKVDKYRNMTKVNAREWYEYAKSAGKDPTTALHLCMSAAGTKDYCEAG